jgi:cysteine desulfurase/selenocysteine lyase
MPSTKPAQASSKAQKTAGFNVEQVRKDFPALHKRVNGHPLIYLDTAASCHKPKVLVDRLSELYLGEYAKPSENHPMSLAITEQVKEARQKVADLLNASKNEIVFLRGCTEAINLVASGFERCLLQPGDEVVIFVMAHHSNYLPWERACNQSGATLKVLPITASGEIDLNLLEEALTDKTRLLSIEHSSHVLGTINPVKEIVKLAHKRGNIAVLVDGAQAAPHMPVDVRDLGCDFYTFSAHKMGGPSGVGVLYGRTEWLKKLPPYEMGEEMVDKVSNKKGRSTTESTFKSPPDRFEGGTQSFVEIIAFGAVIDYLEKMGRQASADYEQELLDYSLEKLSPIDRLRIIGSAPEKEPLVSFTLDGIKATKAESWFNKHTGIALRAGDLSAQPLMKALGVEGVLRISLGYFNTRQEIDRFTEALQECIEAEG